MPSLMESSGLERLRESKASTARVASAGSSEAAHNSETAEAMSSAACASSAAEFSTGMRVHAHQHRSNGMVATVGFTSDVLLALDSGEWVSIAAAEAAAQLKVVDSEENGYLKVLDFSKDNSNGAIAGMLIGVAGATALGAARLLLTMLITHACCPVMPGCGLGVRMQEVNLNLLPSETMSSSSISRLGLPHVGLLLLMCSASQDKVHLMQAATTTCADDYITIYPSPSPSSSLS